MGGGGSGRQKASGASDAYIRVTTALDGADQVVDSFEGMTDAAERYNSTITTSTGLDADAADMHYELAKAVDKESDSKKNNNVESAAMIIMAQGAASALNQVTGGVYKSVGALEQMNLISEDTAESVRGGVRVFEVFAGGLEVILGLYTLKIAADAAMTASTTGLTGAVVTNTAAVAANAKVWLTHPVVLVVTAVIVLLGLLYLLIKDIVDHTEKWAGWVEGIKEGIGSVAHDIKEIASFDLGFIGGMVNAAGSLVTESGSGRA